MLLWQVLHADDVATCPAACPSPSFRCGTTRSRDVIPACEKDAPENVTVLLRQVSHADERHDTPLCGSPIAVVPLWHDAQPDVMPACSKRAAAKVTVFVWHVSHGADVAM